MRSPIFSAHRLAAMAAVAGLAALAPVGAIAATAAPPAVTTASPGCTTAGLVVWLDTQGNGALGSTYYNLELTNLAGHACTLSGYPRVAAVSLTGHQLGRAASHNPAATPGSVKLAPGATATAVLQIVEAFNFPSAICHQVTAAGLRVYPPGNAKAKVVPFPFPACSGATPTYLSVERVTKA